MSTVTMPLKTIEKVERQLTKALEGLREIKKNSKDNAKPKLWTKKQWEEKELEADEDIKAGRVYELENVKDLDRPIDELFK